MFCRVCGTEMREGATYCSKCGNKNSDMNVKDKEPCIDKVKLSKKRTRMIILGVLVVVLIFAIVFGNVKKSDSTKQKNEKGAQHNKEQIESSDKIEDLEIEETLYCPNFKGQTIDSINQNADYYSCFQFETIWEYNDEFEYSYVYEQSVAEGSEISKGTQVILYVSMGEDRRYEEVAKQYASAIFMYDYGIVKECLPYNSDNLVSYTNWPEGWINWQETFSGMSQSYTIQTDVMNSWKIDKNEILQVVSVIDGVCSSYGENIFDANNGINVDKITKGYQVVVSVTPFEIEENERYPSAEVTYTVVMYDGKWKILSDFILDYKRQDEAGKW